MEERETRAREFDDLAQDERFVGRDNDLRSLAEALRNVDDGSWTGVDLIAAFPADASVSVRHRQGLERVLGVFAGVSVFLPVGWTWLSLHSATTAYDELLAAGAENGRTFLALWTTGFDGRLDGSHRLVPMAMVSFVLVLFAVSCIVLHRLMAEFNVAREEKVGQAAYRQLVTSLVGAQRLLNERRTDDPRFIEQAIKRSIGELNKAHEVTRRGIEALENAQLKAVDDLQSATAGLSADLRPLLASAEAAGQSLARSAESAVAAQQQLSLSSAEVHGGLERALSDFRTAVQESNARLTDQTAASVAGITTGVDAVVSRLGTGVESSLTELTRELATVLDRLGSSVSGHADASTASADGITAGLEANRLSTEQITSQVGRLVELLRNHESTMQAQAGELVRAADLSEQMLDELRMRSQTAVVDG